MKHLLTLLILLITTLSFAQGKTFVEVVVAGNRVNIRTEPNLNCKVVYQRNWGDTFLGAKYNDEWYELIDEESNVYYGFHKYIKEVNPVTPPTTTYTTPSTPVATYKAPFTPVVTNNPSRTVNSGVITEKIYPIAKTYPIGQEPKSTPRTVIVEEEIPQFVDNTIEEEEILEVPSHEDVEIEIPDEQPITKEVSIEKPEPLVEEIIEEIIEQPMVDQAIEEIEEKPIVKEVIETPAVVEKVEVEKVNSTKEAIEETVEVINAVEEEEEVEEMPELVEHEVVQETIEEVVVEKIIEEKPAKVEEKIISQPMVDQTVEKIEEKPIEAKKVIIEQPVEEVVERVVEEKPTVVEVVERVVEEKPVIEEGIEEIPPSKFDQEIEEVGEIERELSTEEVALTEAQVHLEELTQYIQLEELNNAREKAIYIINNHVDQSTYSHLGSCILVGEEAYSKFRSLLRNDGTRIPELRKLLNDVYDPLIVNIIRLDIVDNWIQKEEYQYALDIMENMMTHNSESLTLPKHCEDNPNRKASPQIELKNKYFLVYHLLDKKKKEEILGHLKELSVAKNPVTQSIARDIYEKLSGDFWEKN